MQIRHDLSQIHGPNFLFSSSPFEVKVTVGARLRYVKGKNVLTMEKTSFGTGLLMLKRGQERSERLCSVREKKEKKERVWKEQPTCYHTVFNNSVAATRGLHVHATAVQCLLSVCATHEKAPIQKSKHSALSVSSRLQGGSTSLCPLIKGHRRLLSPNFLVNSEHFSGRFLLKRAS